MQHALRELLAAILVQLRRILTTKGTTKSKEETQLLASQGSFRAKAQRHRDVAEEGALLLAADVMEASQ